MFAAKGVREVSIGHSWVNLGHTPFITNFDAFLIHGPTPQGSACLAFMLSFLKSIGVFAKLSDTSNGGSFVQSHWKALPIPKFSEEFIHHVAALYTNPEKAAPSPPSVSGFVAYHRARNADLGIWELDAEMKVLKAELAAVQEEVIQGRTISIPLGE
jgi:hypothetical protein